MINVAIINTKYMINIVIPWLFCRSKEFINYNNDKIK